VDLDQVFYLGTIAVTAKDYIFPAYGKR